MERWVPFFIILASVALTAQALFVIAAYFFMRRQASLIERTARETLLVLRPIPQRLQAIIEQVQARLPTLLSEAEEMARVARHEVQHTDHVISDVMDRFHSRMAHLDDILASAFDTVEHTGQAVKYQVSRPVRAVMALARGLQTGYRVYRGNHHNAENRYNDYPSERDRYD